MPRGILGEYGAQDGLKLTLPGPPSLRAIGGIEYVKYPGNRLNFHRGSELVNPLDRAGRTSVATERS